MGVVPGRSKYSEVFHRVWRVAWLFFCPLSRLDKACPCDNPQDERPTDFEARRVVERGKIERKRGQEEGSGEEGLMHLIYAVQTGVSALGMSWEQYGTAFRAHGSFSLCMPVRVLRGLCCCSFKSIHMFRCALSWLPQNLPFMVMLARVTAESARQAPNVANVIATVANMCCGMVQRRLYE